MQKNSTNTATVIALNFNDLLKSFLLVLTLFSMFTTSAVATENSPFEASGANNNEANPLVPLATVSLEIAPFVRRGVMTFGTGVFDQELCDALTNLEEITFVNGGWIDTSLECSPDFQEIEQLPATLRTISFRESCSFSSLRRIPSVIFNLPNLQTIDLRDNPKLDRAKTDALLKAKFPDIVVIWD